VTGLRSPRRCDAAGAIRPKFRVTIPSPVLTGNRKEGESTSAKATWIAFACRSWSETCQGGIEIPAISTVGSQIVNV